MSEQIIITLLAGISPLLFSFIFKIIENKNETSIRKKAYTEAQDKMNFISAYYDVQTKLLDENALSVLKANLANELADTKLKLNNIHDKEDNPYEIKLNLNDRIFLMFVPKSFLGYIWNFSFYVMALFNIFALIGNITDENSNLTSEALTTFFTDIYSLMFMFILISIMLAFRHLGIRDLKKHVVQSSNQ